MSTKKQNILMVMTILFIGLIIIGSTYAFWTWNSNTTKNVIINTSDDLKNYVVYDEGNSTFSGSFEASNTYNHGMHSTISLYKTQEVANIDLTAIIHMNINQIGTNMASSTALKWVVTSGTSNNPGSEIASGNFVGVNSGDVLTLVPNITVTMTETFYTVWIWLDGNLNPSSNLTGETLDVNVWTEINQTEGILDSFEITNLTNRYQSISATIIDNKYKIIGYAVTTTETEPNEWTSINANDQSNVYNFNFTVSNTGTYYLWFKDENGNVTHEAINITTIDSTPPVCTWESFSSGTLANGETATITLTCTDSDSAITNSNLTSSDITISSNVASVTNISKQAVTNGYQYTITIEGTENAGSFTLSLNADSVQSESMLGNAMVTSSTMTLLTQYTIHFVSSNGCSMPSDTLITYDESTNINNPTCTGYTFSGWTADSGLDTTNAKYGNSESAVNTTWSNGSTPTMATWFSNLALLSGREVTLTANWTANTYTVTVDANGGTLPATSGWTDMSITTNSLPSTYHELEYIESDGNQYIDTGYKPSATTGVEVTYTMLDLLQQQRIFGVENSASIYYSYYINGSSAWAYAYNDASGNWISTGTTATVTEHTFKLNVNPGYYSLDNGTDVAMSGSITGTSATNLYIFSRNLNTSGTSYPSSLKLYVFKIYESGILVRNYVPCYRVSDGVVGLYETTEGTFYTNQGTGSFIRGMDTESRTLTYNSAYGTLPTPTRNGYNFAGWNTQSDGSGVTVTSATVISTASDHTLYAQWTGKTITATFYYQSNATSGSTTISSTTATCTVSNEYGNCNVTIPSAVTGSVGTYNNSYVGLARSTGTLTANVDNSATTAQVFYDATYYSLYRTAVTVYRPSSTSACTTQQYYRNQWFTSTSAMADTVLSTNTSGTSNVNPTMVSGYTFSQLTTAASSGGTGYTVANAAKTNTTTFYTTETKSVSITGTFYYNSNATNGSTTVSSKTASASGTNTLHCTSTSAAAATQGNALITIPSEVRSSVGTYNNAYAGLSVGTGNMSEAVASSSTTVSINANKTYYSLYRTAVTVHRPSSTSACTTQQYYRNQWFTSTSAMADPVLSTSTTGTSNVSPTMVSGYTFSKLTTSASSGGTGYSLANAAKTNTTTFYTTETKSVTATFSYCGNTSNSVLTTTASGTQTLHCSSTSAAAISNGAISVPSTVSSSACTTKNYTYKGVSTAKRNINPTTSVTTATTNYYAVYTTNDAMNRVSATFRKGGSDVSSVGSTSASCYSIYAINETYFDSYGCNVTLPSITPVSGKSVYGWYNSSHVYQGQAGATVVATPFSNYTFTAWAGTWTLLSTYSNASTCNSSCSGSLGSGYYVWSCYTSSSANPPTPNLTSGKYCWKGT